MSRLFVVAAPDLIPCFSDKPFIVLLGLRNDGPFRVLDIRIFSVNADVALYILKFVVFEHNSDEALDFFLAAAIQRIIVFPTILVERVDHQRRTKNVADFPFGHTRFELGHFTFCDDITLLNVDTVRLQTSAQGQGQSENGDDTD